MKLLESYNLSGTELKNRIVMAPMTRSRANSEHVPTDIMGTYYGQRSGAGLIITEGTGPSINGAGYPRIPGLYTQAQADAWKTVTDSVHAEGGLIFVQLMHTGRVTHPANLDEGGQVLAPSAVALTQTKMYTDQTGAEEEIPAPTAMSTEQVQEAIQEFVHSSELAVQAGFDGVELHGANGYLIEQFIGANSNQRTDQYGGSIENRARFVIEVAAATAAAIGKEKVGIRLSPFGVFNEIFHGEDTAEMYAYLATELGKLGIAYIHIVDHSAMGAPEVPQSIKESIRDNFGGTIILSGGYDRDRAEADLVAGLGHLVAYGRPFISNPDLPVRLEQGLELAQPDFGTFYTPGPKGYIDYPTAEAASA